MRISEFLSPQAVIADMQARTKPEVLRELSTALVRAHPQLQEERLVEVLREREKLGSTGVGSGIAIPHGKLPGVTRITGVFARLEQPVEFEALDDEPVDIVFLLLAPEGAGADHLKALSRIARVLRDGETVRKIRGTKDAAAIYAFLAQGPTSNAA